MGEYLTLVRVVSFGNQLGYGGIVRWRYTETAVFIRPQDKVPLPKNRATTCYPDIPAYY